MEDIINSDLLNFESTDTTEAEEWADNLINNLSKELEDSEEDEE